MGLKIKALHIGDVCCDWSWLLFGYNAGRKSCVPVNSFLILGSESPILVDTGMHDPKIMENYLMLGTELPEQDIVKLVREQGVEPEDVGYIIHTHLHADHCGKNHLFPNAKSVIQRKEIAFSAGEYMPGQCPDLHWFVENIDRVEFIDGDIELFPGIKCVLSIAHTGGHQYVEVETDDGKAIMCGDNVYDIPMQLEGKHPSEKIWPTGNFYDQGKLQWELYKLKKELERGLGISAGTTKAFPV